MSDKYLKAFQAAIEAEPETMTVIGDCILVELIPDEEHKTKSGLVLAPGAQNQINGLSADKPSFVRVLVTGQGYYDDSDDKIEKSVPLDSKPGDIVLVGRTSIKPFSVFGRLLNYGEKTLGLIRESDIQIRFRGQEGYDRFFDALNRAIEKKVES